MRHSWVLLVMMLWSCAGQEPDDLGVNDGQLAPCPTRPNCVSSDAADAEHHVAAYVLNAAPEPSWATVREIVAAYPRTTIVTVDDTYLHAECRSRLFGFVDDLELHLRPDDAIIAIRSASRVGYSDLGANRTRVDEIRALLQQHHIVD